MEDEYYKKICAREDESGGNVTIFAAILNRVLSRFVP
jgi:hypothetical protein